MQIVILAVLYALATATLCAAMDAKAQFPGGGMRRGNRDSSSGATSSTRNQPPVTQESLANQIEYRLDLLRDDLKLSPSQ